MKSRLGGTLGCKFACAAEEWDEVSVGVASMSQSLVKVLEVVRDVLWVGAEAPNPMTISEN